MSVSHLKACRKSFMSHLVDIPKIIALFFGASSIKGIVIFLELWFHLIEGFHPIHSKEWPFSLLLPIVSLTTFSLLFHSTLSQFSHFTFSIIFLTLRFLSTFSLQFLFPCVYHYNKKWFSWLLKCKASAKEVFSQRLKRAHAIELFCRGWKQNAGKRL